MEKLLRLADELGLTVIEKRGRHLAGYRPDECVVRLPPKMPHATLRSLLAHEIAHHVLGHLPTDFGPLRARQERSANEWAAQLLLTRDMYATAELIRDGHVPSIAHDLDVSPEIVIAYQNIITRERARALA